MPKYYTVDNAAEEMQCSPKTIRRMIKDGRLKHTIVGKRSVRVMLPEPEVVEKIKPVRQFIPRNLRHV